MLENRKTFITLTCAGQLKFLKTWAETNGKKMSEPLLLPGNHYPIYVCVAGETVDLILTFPSDSEYVSFNLFLHEAMK